MSSQAWLLCSYSTWGEYTYVHGAFSTKEEGRRKAEEHFTLDGEGNTSFGWTLTAIPFNRFDLRGVDL